MTEPFLALEPLTLAQGDAEIAAAQRLARRWADLRAEALAAALGASDPVDALLDLIRRRTVVSVAGLAAAAALGDELDRALAQHRTLIDVPVYETVRGRRVRARTHTVEQYDDEGHLLVRHSIEVSRLVRALDDALDWIVARSATVAGSRSPTHG